MPLSTHSLRIRDPFIVPLQAEQRYLMFGRSNHEFEPEIPEGFDVYSSADLQSWDGPTPAFRPPPGFWPDRDFWAPEVHFYQDRWYMLASFKAEGICRATQILVADNPRGPYVPHGDGPVTPRDWECLDGTLFIDEANQPWMVFCHEWLQVHDGEMNAIRLSPDLSHAIGEPLLLFRASAAPWSKPFGPNNENRVTDGPWLHRTASGVLLMLWSTGGYDGYTIGCARSVSGHLVGPWTQDPEPLYGKDGGHGMLFRTFDGRLLLAIHGPNERGLERPLFLPIREAGDGLVLAL